MNFSMKVRFAGSLISSAYIDCAYTQVVSLAPICSARGGVLTVPVVVSDLVLSQMMFTRLYWMCCIPYRHIFHTHVHAHARCASIFLTWRRQSQSLWVTGYAAQMFSHDKTRLLAATLWIKRPCFRNVSRYIITFACGGRRNLTDCERNRVELPSFCSTLWGLSCNSLGESVRENICIDWMRITTWAES